MRKQWVIGGAVMAVAIGAALLVMKSNASQRDSAKASEGKAVPALEFLPIEIASPTLGTLDSVIEFSGPLVAPGTAVVRSKAPGTLLSLQVGEGSRVKAGQILGQVDLIDLQNRVNERHATQESARVQFEQAQRQYEANKNLAQQKFISETALESSRASMESARGGWLAAKAQADSSRVTIRDAALVAPISGIVAKRHALAGEKLSAEQPVLTIVDLAKLELAATVGTHQVSALKVGMPVQIKVEGSSAAVQAQIARIAPAAEPGTRSIGVALALDNAQENYRAGQYASARVVLRDNQQRLTLPQTAILRDSGQDQVWLLEGGKLQRRTVTTGRADAQAGRIELLAGITAQQNVLALRFENIKEGAAAKVVNQRSAPKLSELPSPPSASAAKL